MIWRVDEGSEPKQARTELQMTEKVTLKTETTSRKPREGRSNPGGL